MKKVEVGSKEYEHIKAKIRFSKITKRLDYYAKNVGSENFIIYYIPNEIPGGLFFPEFNNGVTDCENYFRKIDKYKEGRLQAIIVRIVSEHSFDYKIIEKDEEGTLITDKFPSYMLPEIFPEHHIRLNTTTNFPIYQ